jgi:plastocyanin
MADRQLRTRIVRALGGALVGAALIAGTALAADHAVAISGFSFSPANLTVAVGDTVTWTNSDAQGHTATADDASWDSGSIGGSGGTQTVTFSTAGSFPYHCSVHPEMTGTITVQAATGGGGGGATTPPTDTAPEAAADTGSGAAAALVVIAGAWLAGLAIARRRLARG